MSDLITTTVIVATIASGIRLATPFLLAALGEAIGQRSGVLNLGVDGVMLLGAFGAYYVVLNYENLWAGVLVGILIGMLMGILYAVITVPLRAEQGVSGIGIYLFGLGFSDLLFQKVASAILIRYTCTWTHVVQPYAYGLHRVSISADNRVCY